MRSCISEEYLKSQKKFAGENNVIKKNYVGSRSPLDRRGLTKTLTTVKVRLIPVAKYQSRVQDFDRWDFFFGGAEFLGDGRGRGRILRGRTIGRAARAHDRRP
jgi:hypothetical protein